MPASRHLQSAPISEAIIDFRVKARPDFHAEEFSALKSSLADRYPKVDEQRGQEFKFDITNGKGPSSHIQDLGLRGYFFRSMDGKNIAQFRVDGFTFNRLRPYTSWDELFPQAMELWNMYSGIAMPQVITRLAVRYINRIPLPPGDITFETYLRAAPIIPAELPQTVSSFLTRVTIHEPTAGIAAHVTQALETHPTDPGPSVILDIDAFKESEFAVNDPEIGETLNRLREFKNLIFFGSLTEEILRQFQ